jgi:hypothetical protein
MCVDFLSQNLKSLPGITEENCKQTSHTLCFSVFATFVEIHHTSQTIIFGIKKVSLYGIVQKVIFACMRYTAHEIKPHNVSYCRRTTYSLSPERKYLLVPVTFCGKPAEFIAFSKQPLQ